MSSAFENLQFGYGTKHRRNKSKLKEVLLVDAGSLDKAGFFSKADLRAQVNAMIFDLL